MADLARDISGSALQVQTTGQFVKLSKGQVALLDLLRTCVATGTPLTWDLLVLCYYTSVAQRAKDWRWDHVNGRKEYYDYDIMEVYEEQGAKWTYYVRGRIRTWFMSCIGSLVLRNELIVIPTIKLPET